MLTDAVEDELFKTLVNMETEYSQTIKTEIPLPTYHSDIDNELHHVEDHADSSQTISKVVFLS